MLAAPSEGRFHVKPLLFYTGGFAPVGGVESFTSDLALALHRRGVRGNLACWGSHHQGIVALEEAGLRVLRSPWRWGCRWGWPDGVLALLALGRLRRADTVVFSKTFGQRVHRVLRALNPRASFVLVTAYRPSEMWGRSPHPRLRQVLNGFDRIIVQAGVFETDLRTLGYRGEVRVLPYVPPSATVTPTPAMDVLRVGFLGRLVEQKNLSYLLASMSELARARQAQGKGTELWLIGDGLERHRLEENVRALSLQGNVRFLGAIAREQLGPAVDACHLFAFSSTSEGQCLAALDVLSRGRPVVATPVGAFPEMLEDGRLGAVAPLGDPRSFAAVIAQIAARLESREMTPEGIGIEYERSFPRDGIISAYHSELTQGSGKS